MKKFLISSVFFLLPIFLLAINYIFYKNSGGDLSRLGKISINQNYRNIFVNDFNKKKEFKDYLQINSNDTIKFLIFGDSFSQSNYSYQNHLASTYNLNVYNISPKYFINQNQIQTIFSFLNNGFFDTLQIDYIVLQCVVRDFVWKGLNCNDKDTKKIVVKENNLEINNLSSNNSLGIFRDFFDFFVFSILYNFKENAYFSQVYKFELSTDLFSQHSNLLLCYDADISVSNSKDILKLNDVLNSLSDLLLEKNIKLIVVPSPDKYDMYYNFIKNNHYPENPFFETISKAQKSYNFINTKQLLLEKTEEGVKDIYFVDDTHWSPVGHQIVANEIYRITYNNK